MGTQELLSYGFFAGVIAMAVLHGMLLCGIFLFHKRLRSKANRFLALAIFGICIVLMYEAAEWLGVEGRIPIWFQYMPFYIRTAIPVGVFYFVVYFIDTDHELKAVERYGLYVLILDVFLELCYVPVSLLSNSEVMVDGYEELLFNAQGVLSIASSVFLLPLALKKVNQYQQNLYDNYTSDHKRNLNWLRYFLISLLVCVGLWIITFGQYFFGLEEEALWTFSVLTIGMVLILFWIGYFLILHNNWFELVPVLQDQANGEGKLSSKADNYHQQLLKLMSEDRLFENVDLTLNQLAEKLQISSGYLSQIIKEKEGKNLFEFVNYYRVEAVKEKLTEQKHQNLTLMGIAMESGFNSKSTFHSVFKKFTGQTPSSFKNQHWETQ